MRADMLLTSAEPAGGGAGGPAAPETATSTQETAAARTPARRPPRPQSALDLFSPDLVPPCRMTTPSDLSFRVTARAAAGHVKRPERRRGSWRLLPPKG